MSQFCTNPSQEHLSQALYIVRYLGSTKNLALRYNGANHDSFLGYTDSDWAANPDDRKSITGYVLFLANSPVSWLTRQQKTVASILVLLGLFRLGDSISLASSVLSVEAKVVVWRAF